MAFLSNFDISGYGLSAQRTRVNVISSNIANAQTTRTDEGGPYRKKSVIYKAFDFDKVFSDENWKGKPGLDKGENVYGLAKSLYIDMFGSNKG